MPALIFIAFAAFGGCIVAQFLWIRKFRLRLIEHHPEKFLEIEKASFFPGNGLMRFAIGPAHKKLGDAELDKIGRTIKLIWIPTILAWLGYAAALVTLG